MPAWIVTGEGVYLVDDDGLEVGEEFSWRHEPRHQQGLKRFGRGHQVVRASSARRAIDRTALPVRDARSGSSIQDAAAVGVATT